MGCVAEMVYGYRVGSNIARKLENREAVAMKRLLEDKIYLCKYDENSHLYFFESDGQDSYMLGVSLDTETTEEIIADRNEKLKDNKVLQLLLSKYGIDKKPLIRTYGYRS